MTAGFDRYTVTVTDTVYQVNLPGQIAGPQFVKGGFVPIPSGSDTATVSFVTQLPSAVSNYFVIATIQNTADSFPEDLIVRVSGFTVNNVTFSVNTITDTANYKINWMIGSILNG